MMRLVQLTALLAAASLPRADVHVVDASAGPGSEFSAIQDAVDAAAPGDTLLLRAGDYGPFYTLGKGLSLVADSGAIVRIQGEPLLQTVPADEVLLLRGLLIEQQGTPSGFGVVSLYACEGTVWIEDCSIETAVQGAGQPYAALFVQDCAQVTVVHSTLLGRPGFDPFGGSILSPGGIRAERSHVTVQGSLLSAEDADPASAFSGGTALVAEDSIVTVEGSVLRGGNGADGDAFGCVGKNGGHALFIQGPGAVFVGKDNTYEPGQGGAGAGACPSGKPGVAVFPFAGALARSLPGVARRLAVGSPLREGEGFAVTCEGLPGEAVSLLASRHPRARLSRTLGGTLLVARPLDVQFLGVLDASGKLVVSQVAPPLPAGVGADELFLQAVFADGLGGFVLGEASAVTHLDADL